MKSQKALGEHQLSELRKRIEEVEETASTYKSQLAQQTQLHNQQQQISNNEIQKLQNSIELMQADHHGKETELHNGLKQLEDQNEELFKKIQELEQKLAEAPRPSLQPSGTATDKELHKA